MPLSFVSVTVTVGRFPVDISTFNFEQVTEPALDAVVTVNVSEPAAAVQLYCDVLDTVQLVEPSLIELISVVLPPLNKVNVPVLV